MYLESLVALGVSTNREVVGRYSSGRFTDPIPSSIGVVQGSDPSRLITPQQRGYNGVLVPFLPIRVAVSEDCQAACPSRTSLLT